MNIAALKEHLAMAERHVAEAGARVERQRVLVHRLGSRGLDTGIADYMLDSFERFEAICVGDRDRLLVKIWQTLRR